MDERVGTKAVLALVFGILSLEVCPCVGSLLAILLGWGERSGVGRAGFVLGWISLLIYGGVALLALLALVVGGVVAIAQS
jgi:hypothetical protein